MSLARRQPRIHFFARQTLSKVVVDVVALSSTSASVASAVRRIALRAAAPRRAWLNNDARAATIDEAPKASPIIVMPNDVDEAPAWGINLPENLKLMA